MAKPGVVTYVSSYNTNTQKLREEDHKEFKASLVYKTSELLATHTQ